jgi:hypothetical protein
MKKPVFPLLGEEEEEDALGYPNRERARGHLTLEGGGSLPATNN